MTGYPNEDEGPDEVKWEDAGMTEKPEHTPLPELGYLYVDGSHGLIGVDLAKQKHLLNCGTVMGAVNAVPDLVKALEEARDLLLEIKQGSHARSPNHNARLVIEAALAKVKPFHDIDAKTGTADDQGLFADDSSNDPPW
jgi:hypothetical protein